MTNLTCTQHEPLAEVTTYETPTLQEWAQNVRQCIDRVAARIDYAYENYLPSTALEATKHDRKLLRAQVRFLEHLEGKRR